MSIAVSACASKGGDSTVANNSIAATVSPAPSPYTSPAENRGVTSTESPIPDLSPLPPDARGVQAAIDVVQAYYDAINSRDYRRAYEFWSGKGEASGQTFEAFRDGFSNTESVRIDTSGEPGDLEGAAGSQYVTIPIRIYAKTKDGIEQRFWGEYVLRRSMVDGATDDQKAWRLYRGQIKEL